MTLTQKQHTVVKKIAKMTGMDCWFYIRQAPSGDDYVQDLETNRRLTLRQGLQGFVDGIASYDGINDNEIKIFEELLDQLDIEKPEVN